MDITVFGFSLTTWTSRSLWMAMTVAIAAAIVYASVFLIGYAAHAFWPTTRFARYFDETDLFTLWMVSMICALGLSLLLYLQNVTRFSTQDPLLGVLFTMLSVAATASPLIAVMVIGKTHHHVRAKRHAAPHSTAHHKTPTRPATAHKPAGKAAATKAKSSQPKRSTKAAKASK